MKTQRLAALAAAIMLGAGAFQPFYISIFARDRARLATALKELPYRKLPGLLQFFSGVRERTRNGDIIAVYAPLPHWQDGYDYFYARAVYILAGRIVLPLIGPDDRQYPENISRALYIAAYRSIPAPPGFALIWRGPDGALLRRLQ